jgi:phosphoribosyl 1,2-cyclic phosphate phosphodiesterase
MKITFLGTGTSQGIPLIGCKCAVCTSQDEKDKRLRSSVLIEDEGSIFVIDTGPDFRQQMLREKVSRLDAVIYTHEHRDHIAGLDDLRAFNFIMGKAIDLYTDENVESAIRRTFPYIFSETKYPGIPEINFHRFTTAPFTINKTEFIPIHVLHHKMPVCGFRIKNFTYITDANLIPEEEKKKILGSDVLVLNALRKEKHVSHFSFSEAIELVKELKPGMAYFTHISHQLGRHEEINAELPPNIRLACDSMVLNL